MRSKSRRDKFTKKPSSPSTSPNNYGILPPPGILESYEEVSKGSVAKILEMVKSEQDHRHRFENTYLRGMMMNYRIGQLLVFMLAIIVLYSAIAFMITHDRLVAIVALVGGFGFLCIWMYANKRHKPQFKAKNFDRGHKKQ